MHPGPEQLVLCRIEDTDQARSTKESEDAVLRDLAWLGIKWDEGAPAAPFHATRAFSGCLPLPCSGHCIMADRCCA